MSYSVCKVNNIHETSPVLNQLFISFFSVSRFSEHKPAERPLEVSAVDKITKFSWYIVMRASLLIETPLTAAISFCWGRGGGSLYK